MKFSKYLSLISILLTIIAVAIKVQVDMHTYEVFKKMTLSEKFQPIGSIDNSIVWAVTILVISFGFVIFGLEKNSKWRKLALTLAIIAVFYLLVPFGMFLVR